jgi:hypothetical protein
VKANVTVRRLSELLVGLEKGSYIIVSAPIPRGTDRFIQAYREQGSSWYVEYRDGGPDRQYGAECHATEMVFDLLLAWVDKRDDWRKALPWERVDLG